jgi:hypothetical protein
MGASVYSKTLSGIIAGVVGASLIAAPAKAKKFSYPYANLGAPQLSVYEVNNVPQIRNLNIGYDRTARCLRWQDITRNVENTYNLPPNILLGIMANETGGNLLLPNLGNNFFFYANYARKTSQEKKQKEVPVVAEKLVGIGEEYFPKVKPKDEIIDAMFSDSDAGLGAFQQQNSTAAQYGLSRVTDSKKLIDRTQAKIIGRKIYANKFDIKYLALEDDRWHLVKTADAAGRMLADYYTQSRSKTEPERWNYALYRYSGRTDYASKVNHFMRLLGDKEHLLKTAKRFEKRNKNATIGAEPLTFDKYCWFYNSYAASMFDLQGYLQQTRHYVVANISSGALPAIGMREQTHSRAALTLPEYESSDLGVEVIRNNFRIEKVSTKKTPLAKPLVETKQKIARADSVKPARQKKKKQTPANITPFVTLETLLAKKDIDPNLDEKGLLPTNVEYTKSVAEAPLIEKPKESIVQLVQVNNAARSKSAPQHNWYPAYSEKNSKTLINAPHSRNYGHFTTMKGFTELLHVKDYDDMSVAEEIEYHDRPINKLIEEMFRAA